MNRRLKIALITLLIILVSIISFAGLFVQHTKFMENIIPEYQLGMDLDGYRVITVKASDETETKYYDKDGNEVEEEAKDGTTKEVPVNTEDMLNIQNYKKAKEVIEKRLSDLNIAEYLIRLDEKDGRITVQLPENSMTDTASQFLNSRGVFTIEDEDGNVLLNNDNLKSVQVGYSNQSTSGTTVLVRFNFNDDSVDKLKEISNTYVSSTDEEGNDTSKKVSIKLDGSTLISTTFSEELANGVLPLTLGTATDTSTLNTYMNQATNIAILLNNGTLPIEYTMDQNRFIKSDITMDDFIIPAIVVGAILLISFVILIIRYKTFGLLGIVSYIGYMAILLLIVRYTNLIITMEGIFGLLISAVLNYILIVYILETVKKTEKDREIYKKQFNKAMTSIISILIPTLIIGIVLCFSTWLPAYSFGTIIFWGVIIIAIYNAIVTRGLFLLNIKEDYRI